MKEYLVYEYKGYEYRPSEEIEEDNRKTFHDIYTPDGERLSLPCSPYDHPTREFFRLWVDANCPYPRGQRVSLEELKEMIFTQITEAELENTN